MISGRITSGSSEAGMAEVKAELKDDPARRKRSAEQLVEGASPDAIEAFSEMQDQARAADAEAPVKRSWWQRLLRR